MHDCCPEASAEAERGDRKHDGGRAPDEETRPKRPEGSEPGTGHEDDRGQQSIDVERTDPLSVLARETDAAAAARLVHSEVGPEELAFTANRTAQAQAPPADGSPVSLRPPGSVMRGRAAPGEDGRGRS